MTKNISIRIEKLDTGFIVTVDGWTQAVPDNEHLDGVINRALVHNCTSGLVNRSNRVAEISVNIRLDPPLAL